MTLETWLIVIGAYSVILLIAVAFFYGASKNPNEEYLRALIKSRSILQRAIYDQPLTSDWYAEACNHYIELDRLLRDEF